MSLLSNVKDVLLTAQNIHNIDQDLYRSEKIIENRINLLTNILHTEEEYKKLLRYNTRKRTNQKLNNQKNIEKIKKEISLSRERIKKEKDLAHVAKIKHLAGLISSYLWGPLAGITTTTFLEGIRTWYHNRNISQLEQKPITLKTALLKESLPGVIVESAGACFHPCISKLSGCLKIAEDIQDGIELITSEVVNTKASTYIDNLLTDETQNCS